MKTIIERGASWTLEETKLLLSLWGQDLVQRQATCQKRSKECYEKISEKINQSGYERTPEQVRTRVFNMIAEYRRILKDPNPERMKKCIFFEALHRIYQAKHMDDVKSALDDYEPECPYSPSSNTISSERGEESISDTEAATAAAAGDNESSTTAPATGAKARAGNETGSTTNHAKKNNASAASEPSNDSINNNNDNSSSTPSGGHKQPAAPEKESSATSQSAKKIKLESSPRAGSSHDGGGDTPTNSSKQKASSASNTNNVSGSKHQSLLLPQSSPATTPINKLASPAVGNSAPTYINVSSSLKNVMGTTRLVGHPNGTEQINVNGTPPTANRLPTAAITSHQFYQAPVTTFDVTSSALLIDRMFAHLSRESENMREWIALEKDRIALERAKRVQETERDSRRERVLIDTLMKFQEQWISFITKIEPRLIERHAHMMPTLNLKDPVEEALDAAKQTSPTQPNTNAPSQHQNKTVNQRPSPSTPSTADVNTSTTTSLSTTTNSTSSPSVGGSSTTPTFGSVSSNSIGSTGGSVAS